MNPKPINKTTDEITNEKSILLITGNYPFHPAEPFLHAELSYLASKFHKIYLLPINGDQRSQSCEIPENVEVLSEISATISLKPIRSLPYSLNSLFQFKPAILHEVRNFPSKWINPILIGKSFWRLNRASQTLKNLEQFVISHDIHLVYSYWFSVGPLISWYLQKNIPGRIVTISRAHGYDLYKEANLFNYCPFQSFLLKHLSWIVPISNQGKDYLAIQFP